MPPLRSDRQYRFEWLAKLSKSKGKTLFRPSFHKQSHYRGEFIDTTIMTLGIQNHISLKFWYVFLITGTYAKQQAKGTQHVSINWQQHTQLKNNPDLHPWTIGYRLSQRHKGFSPSDQSKECRDALASATEGSLGSCHCQHWWTAVYKWNPPNWMNESWGITGTTNWFSFIVTIYMGVTSITGMNWYSYSGLLYWWL